MLENEMIVRAMESLGAAVTIINPEGVMLYYNSHAPKILDRNPDLIGQEVFSCHKRSSSSDKVRAMLEAFRKGRTEPFRYRAKPRGEPVFVTVSPIFDEGTFIGCVQSVILVSDIESVS